MRVLAIVTARGGSKRLPRKNVLPLGGVPLIAWTIRTALASRVCCAVVVSTDDAEIADAAKLSGAEVPSLRPAELATDTASSIDVVLHALNTYERAHGAVDAVMLLQPTSPFRQVETIKRAVEMHISSKGLCVVGVTAAASHPAWCFQIVEGRLRAYIDNKLQNTRSQELPAAYAVNGAMYIASVKKIRESLTFFPEDTLPLIMEDAIECLDIDTPSDWIMAQSLVFAGAVQIPNSYK